MPSTRNRCNLPSRNSKVDFTKVGGLTDHLDLLREMIILPLLYGQVFNSFHIKAPKGVIFYGPPGTGKTLVAAALATELNKEGCGKVTFFQRKGADILDKWVGESEKKLRELFEKAMKYRPAVIFFDELDGLAPERSQRNDQVHTSVVATLLALMDGLDSKPGVIVIGATNRIDSIDGALRRPGRFDRELYFPLPSIHARKEILEVHMNGWKHSLDKSFLFHLAEITTGYCGSDLQALCTEAVMCSLKRRYPGIHKTSFGNRLTIDVNDICVQECDFLSANSNLVPTTQRLGNCKVRSLSPFIKPLLQRQLDRIMSHVKVLLPQFSNLNAKFTLGNERYAGRIILKGTFHQGLHTYILPALLQALEHIPNYVLDMATLNEKGTQDMQQQRPSVLVLSRIDEWWQLIDDTTQVQLSTALEELHAGLPVLLIVTCNRDVPEMLRNYFQYNSSIAIALDDPTVEERKLFFQPLFFGNCPGSLYSILHNENNRQSRSVIRTVKQEPKKSISKTIIPKCSEISNINYRGKPKRKRNYKTAQRYRLKGPDLVDSSMRLREGGKNCDDNNRTHVNASSPELVDEKRTTPLGYKQSKICVKRFNSKCASVQSCCKTVLNYAKKASNMDNKLHSNNRLDRPSCSTHRPVTLNDFVNCTDISNHVYPDEDISLLYSNIHVKEEPIDHSYDSHSPSKSAGIDASVAKIDHLWHRVSTQTSKGLGVGQLELVYDTLRACIRVNRHSGFQYILQGIETTLNKFENACGTHRDH